MKNMAPEKYSETYLTEVIFQVRFSPLLQLYTDKKDAAAKFQNIITKEFPELQYVCFKKMQLKFDFKILTNQIPKEEERAKKD